MRLTYPGSICVALALVAVTPSAATAEPEFLTKAVVGEAVTSVPFSGTVGASFWEAASGGKVKLLCTAGTASGEVVGARSLSNVVLLLTGCESGSLKAQSEGQPSGTIETKALAGKLGGITPTLPGIKLFSEAEGKGGTVLEANAGGIVTFKVRGEATGSLSGAAGEGPATGKLLASINLTFAQSKGVQKYKGFTEGPEAGLLGSFEWENSKNPFEPIGWSLKESLKTIPSTWGLGITK
jgi:hypothetical protein